jgi:hypothetical protein
MEAGDSIKSIGLNDISRESVFQGIKGHFQVEKSEL